MFIFLVLLQLVMLKKQDILINEKDDVLIKEEFEKRKKDKKA